MSISTQNHSLAGVRMASALTSAICEHFYLYTKPPLKFSDCEFECFSESLQSNQTALMHFYGVLGKGNGRLVKDFAVTITLARTTLSTTVATDICTHCTFSVQ